MNERAIRLDPEELSGERILLSPVSKDGLSDFHDYSLRPEIYEHLEFPPFRTIEDTDAYLARLMDRSAGPDAQYWFIRLKDGGKVVGSFGAHSLDSRRRAAEIGYGVSPECWGQGLFKEACAVVIDHLFGALGLHRIVARTSVRNVASIRGLEKLRFRKEGIMRDYYRSLQGDWFDAILLARLSTD